MQCTVLIIDPVAYDDRAQPCLVWLCYRTPCVLWKVELVHVVRCVECDVDGTEEVCIKVEEVIDIKDEMPEAITFPPIKTENEVRLILYTKMICRHNFRIL